MDPINHKPQPFDARKSANKHIQNLLINADIYIAYQQLAQAEHILKNALTEYQNNPDIMLKLLQVYTIGQQSLAFQIIFHRLKRIASQDIQEKALEYKAQLNANNPAKNFNDLSKDQKIQAAAHLELAKAYIEVGDLQSAKPLLEDILLHGDSSHREEASQLLLDQSA